MVHIFYFQSPCWFEEKMADLVVKRCKRSKSGRKEGEGENEIE